MTRFRLIYYGSMLVLLLAGLSTGRREYFFLLAVLVLVVGYALALNLWTIFSFSFVQELSAASVVKGASPTLKIGIYNDKPFPFTMMKIAVQTPVPSERVELAFNLDPNSHIYYDLPLHCPYRGVYRVGMTMLEVSDVFGLLRIRFDLRRLPYYRQKQLVIYPRLLELPYLPAQIRDAKYAGGGVQQISEEGESFSDTRQYRFGDPFKRVHRILSMRKRELFIKRYDVPMETAAIIAVDTAKNRYTAEDSLRYADIACECAAAIAHYSLAAGYVVDLFGAEEGVIEGKSSLDFSKLYDRLAVMAFETEGNLCEMLEQECRRHPNLRAVYVITPRTDAQLAEVLGKLAGTGCSAKCLLPILEKNPTEQDHRVAATGVASAVLTDADEIVPVLAELV